MKEFSLPDFINESSFPLHIQTNKYESDIHKHSDYSELVVTVAGSAVHNLGTESTIIRKGDVFVVGSSVPHGFSEAVGFEIFCILFDPDFFFSQDCDIRSSESFRSFFLGDGRKFNLPPGEFIKICEMLKTVKNEFDSIQSGRQTLLSSYFTALCVTLSRLYASRESAENRSADSIFAAAEFIEQNFTEKLTLDSIAEVSHYSARHFVRIFSDTYHQTPQEYILSLRLKRACELLSEGELSVGQTAQESGFSDGNYFCRVFRKAMGISPGEYRKKYAMQGEQDYDEKRKGSRGDPRT